MASQRRKERRRLKREARERALLAQMPPSAGTSESHATLVTDQPDVPLLVERVAVEVAQNGQTYEEANWAKLSPMFREAHNRLRQLKGLPTIPPPAIDLYRPPLVRRVSPAELEALKREEAGAKVEFLSGGPKGAGIRHMAPGHEGFSINGKAEKF